MRKSLIVAFLVMLAYTASLLVFAFSWGYSGTLSGDGVALAFNRLFGGLPSLGGSLLGILVFALVVVVIWFLASNDMNVAAAAFAAVVILIALYMIEGSLTLPSGEIGTFIVLMLVAAVMTALMWKILVRRTSSPSSASPTTSLSLMDRARAWKRSRDLRRANNQTQVITTTT